MNRLLRVTSELDSQECRRRRRTLLTAITLVLLLAGGAVAYLSFAPPLAPPAAPENVGVGNAEKPAGFAQRRELPHPPPVPVAPAAAPGKKPPPEKEPPKEACFSFHDFRLGMTRRDVHKLLERWKIREKSMVSQRANGWTGLPADRYAGIHAFALGFDDGAGIVTMELEREHPLGEKRLRPLPAKYLTLDRTEARLTLMVFEYEEQRGPLVPLLTACKERFGKPTVEGKPRAVGPLGLGFRDPLTLTAQADERVEWEWPKEDLYTDLHIRHSGPALFEEGAPSFRAAITFHEGAFAKLAVDHALAAEEKRHEEERIRRAAAAINPGKPQDRASLLPDTTYTLLTPTDLHGTWHIHGRGQGIWVDRYEGVLTLEKGIAEKMIRGRIEWLEGGSLGAEDVEGFLLRPPKEHGEQNRLLVLRTVRTDMPWVPPTPGVYVAALRADGKKLLSGERDKRQRFSWHADRLTEEAAKRPGPSPEGTWFAEQRMLQNGQQQYRMTWTRRDGPTDFSLIEGTVTELREHADTRMAGRFKGSYNHRTQRLWVYSLEANDFSGNREEHIVYLFEAYLTPDGNSLTGWARTFRARTGGDPFSGIRRKN